MPTHSNPTCHAADTCRYSSRRTRTRGEAWLSLYNSDFGRKTSVLTIWSSARVGRESATPHWRSQRRLAVSRSLTSRRQHIASGSTCHLLSIVGGSLQLL